MNLDDRAREGAQEIHVAFAHAPIPVAPAARRAPRTLAMVGSLGLVTAVVATAFVLANRDDTREAQGTPPRVTEAESVPVASTLGTDVPGNVSLVGFTHVGLSDVPAGWRRVAAGGPVGDDLGDTDWQRKMTVIETPSGRFVGASIPTDVEPIEESPDGHRVQIGSRTVHVPLDGMGAEWVEGANKLGLFGTFSDALLGEVVPLLEVDADGYLVPIAKSSASLLYRGDIAPLFAVVSPQISEGIPLDEVVGYAGPDSLGSGVSFTVGVLRGRATGLPLIDALVVVQQGTISPLTGRPDPALRGSIPMSTPNGESLRGEFAAIAAGDDLVVVTGAGLDAATFDSLLAKVVSVDDATWSTWIDEAPLEAYFVELEQGARDLAEVPSPTDVRDTAP